MGHGGFLFRTSRAGRLLAMSGSASVSRIAVEYSGSVYVHGIQTLQSLLYVDTDGVAKR